MVKAFEQRMTPEALAEAVTKEVSLPVPSIVDSTPFTDRAATVVTPQATWFARTFCKNNIDIKKTFGTWYQAFDICHETRTSTAGVTWSVSKLRQMFTALHMRTGAATFLMSRRDNSSKPWKVVQNHNVPQGTFRFARLWQVNASTNDIKFEIKNTNGDLFDWAVQTARTPMGSMPIGQFDGGVKFDSYHFMCNCQTANGTYDVGLEYCLTNPLVASPKDDSKAGSEANTFCGNICVKIAANLGASLSVLAGYTTIGRRSNGQASCTPTTGDARLCDRGSLPLHNSNGIPIMPKANCTANGHFPAGWEPSTLQ